MLVFADGDPASGLHEAVRLRHVLLSLWVHWHHLSIFVFVMLLRSGRIAAGEAYTVLTRRWLAKRAQSLVCLLILPITLLNIFGIGVFFFLLALVFPFPKDFPPFVGSEQRLCHVCGAAFPQCI